HRRPLGPDGRRRGGRLPLAGGRPRPGGRGRTGRPLPVLRDRGAAQHARPSLPAGAAALMPGRLRTLLGVDHGGDRYGYVTDELMGPVSASRAPERWVRTPCG